MPHWVMFSYFNAFSFYRMTNYCFRFSLSNFRKETWMTNLPLYALYKIFKIDIWGKIWSECVYCARSVEYVMDKKIQRRFNCSTGDVLDVLCRQSRMKGMRQKKMIFGFEMPWLSHWINNFKKGKELSLTFKV